MECIRCGNKDPTYFHYSSRGYYCRKCIGFNRVLIEEELEPVEYEIGEDAYDFNISYKLTSYQLQASKECLRTLNSDLDVLLHCVCGAGKTEIVVESISDYLKRGLKVCYAISRREVVIELAQRFQKIFENAKVTAIYGGHTDTDYADFIICTNHQLYRFYKTFDLLILDEVDAFPLKGNETLMNISLNSSKGHIIFSTATVDNVLNKVLSKRRYHEIKLYVRPSLKPLIIPKVIYSPRLLSYLYLYKILHSLTNQCIIFVSSKRECEVMYRIYSKFFSCTYVYSDLENRNQNIMDFKNKKYKYCFSTSLLERGISIYDVNVIILDFNQTIFDTSSLVQMLGRVGRNINNPYGYAYIITNHYDKSINETAKYLKEANSYL